MKSEMYPAKHSPLRLAILIGFVGFAAINLADKIATHWVTESEALIRLHTLTGLLSVLLAAVCVYLVTTSASSGKSAVGQAMEGNRTDSGLQTKTAGGVIRGDAAAKRPVTIRPENTSPFDDKVLSLP